MLYFGFRHFSTQRSELVVKLNEYKQLGKQPDVLFLGDSHAERGLDFSQLPYTTSLAYYGENNVMNYYKLKYCIENTKTKPKYLILPCDIITFSKGFNQFRSNKYFYYSLMPLSELSSFEAKPYVAYYEYIKARVFPYAEWQYGLNTGAKERVQKAERKFSDRTLQEREINARYFIQQEMACAGKRENLFYTTALDYLDKTLEFCKQNNIKPVFVKYPLTQEVFNEIKTGISEDCFLNRPAEKVLNAQNIPFLNFEREFAKSPELFFDCHHLNTAGKKVFTPILKQKLDSLLRVY